MGRLSLCYMPLAPNLKEDEDEAPPAPAEAESFLAAVLDNINSAAGFGANAEVGGFEEDGAPNAEGRGAGFGTSFAQTGSERGPKFLADAERASPSSEVDLEV